jgi:hypothetical protein
LDRPERRDDLTHEYGKAWGDSFDFVSDKPFMGKGIYDPSGAGPGGGGRYGTGSAGKDAVHLALGWLARHQNGDGSWSESRHGPRCRTCGPASGDVSDDVATGLALLALLGAGYVSSTRDSWDGIRFGEVIRKGSEWLDARETDDPDALALRAAALGGQSRRNHALGRPGAWTALLEEAPQCDPEAVLGMEWGGDDVVVRSAYLAARSCVREGSKGFWCTMRARLGSTLEQAQNRISGDCRIGSWGSPGRRVAATALRALVFELCPPYSCR